MKTFHGTEVYFVSFLNSALDGGEWSASRPGHYIPRERAPGTHLYPLHKRLGGPQTGLDTAVASVSVVLVHFGTCTFTA